MIVLIYRCAGEIAAVPNTYCAVGVAYGAKVSGKDYYSSIDVLHINTSR